MSGFEIAGVVLAAVPLIVLDLHTAYEKGARGFLRWRRCEREVKYLIRNLETQQIILRNVCETLIIDVADLTEIDDMINNPLGPLWSEPRIQAGVQQKLWHNPALFKEIVKDVNKAVEELKEMLNIDGVEMVSGSSRLPRAILTRLLFKGAQRQEQLCDPAFPESVVHLEPLSIRRSVEENPRRRRRLGKAGPGNHSTRATPTESFPRKVVRSHP